MIKLKDLITEENAIRRMCGNCVHFVKDREQCVILAPPDVVHKGMCDLWEGGEPKTADRVNLIGMTPQAEAHYTDNWRTHERNRE